LTFFFTTNQRYKKISSRKTRCHKRERCRQKLKANQGKLFLLHLRLSVQHFFPSLIDQLGMLPDHRKQATYSTAELAMAAICMFLLKRGSRHAMNQCSEKQTFSQNYYKLFGLYCPHMDAVEDFFRLLAPEHIQRIKHAMLKCLLEKKTLHKFRMLMLYHLVAIDGVCLHSYDYEPFAGCPFREHKDGKKTWSVNVVEAKMVYNNGFCLSLASEYIVSEDGSKKQDCEQKAANRLCKRIKLLFPNLPICLIADGLYPGETMFDLCAKFQWKYIFTFKDYVFETIWREVRFHFLFKLNNSLVVQQCIEDKWSFERWRYINNIEYHKTFSVNWIEYERSILNKKTNNTQKLRFVHITNIDITSKNAKEISASGRLRWTIENQGFNEQKNHDYALRHKFSRKNIGAGQNYYHCLQIAHMIAQLTVMSKAVKEFKGKMTRKSLWIEMFATFILIPLADNEINNVLTKNCQFRY